MTSPLSGQRVTYAIGVLTAGWIIAYLDRYVAGILLEPMRKTLALSDTQLSLVHGFAFALFFVLAGLPIGRLVDRFNRRNILLVGMICWSGATFACGLAENFWQLFAARVAVGIGEACLAPASFSMVADMVSSKRRGASMGLLVGGTAVGNASSIFIGGQVLQHLDKTGGLTLPLLGHIDPWQAVFFVVATPGFAVAFLLLFVKEPQRRERSAAGAANNSFLQTLSRNRAGFGFTIGAFAANMLAANALAAWIAVVLIRVYGMAPAQLGVTIGLILLTFGGISPPIGGILSDWFAKRFPTTGRLTLLLISYPVIALSHVAWFFYDGITAAIIVFCISTVILGGVLNGAAYPALNEMVPNEVRGQTTALYLFIGTIVGLGLAPTIVALITDQVFRDPLMVRYSVILVTVPAALAGLGLSVLALRPYRRTCAASAASIQAN